MQTEPLSIKNCTRAQHVIYLFFNDYFFPRVTFFERACSLKIMKRNKRSNLYAFAFGARKPEPLTAMQNSGFAPLKPGHEIFQLEMPALCGL